MLDLRFMRTSLERTNEDNNVDTGVGKVSYRAQQALVELMQLWATKVIGFGTQYLRVRDHSKVVCKLNLVQRDLFGYLVLNVPYSAICKGIPFYLQIAEDLLKFTENVLDCGAVTSPFQVVDVLGHSGSKSAIAMAHAQFVVDLIAFHLALFLGDFSELDGECPGSVGQSRTWLVTMQDLFLRIKCFEAWKLLE